MDFELEDIDLRACQEEFNQLPPEERLFLTHYELANRTSISDSVLWKKFLLNPKVNDWINQELTLFKDAQLRKLIKDATKNDKSVGAAQMLNALNKTFDSDTAKEGNVFIYSYVPLNNREEHAPNTSAMPYDVFEKGV